MQYFTSSVFCCCCCWTGVFTQVFVLSKQALYHLSHQAQGSTRVLSSPTSPFLRATPNCPSAMWGHSIQGTILETERRVTLLLNFPWYWSYGKYFCVCGTRVLNSGFHTCKTDTLPTWATPPVHCAPVILEMESCNYLPRLVLKLGSSLSASQVARIARIIGVSHWYPVCLTTLKYYTLYFFHVLLFQ
jgi:hypothetical protein